VKIPALRVPMKESARIFERKDKVELQDLRPNLEYGVHIVKIWRGWPQTSGWVSFPCGSDVLVKGLRGNSDTKLWIMPSPRATGFVDVSAKQAEWRARLESAEERDIRSLAAEAAKCCNACLLERFNHVFESLNPDRKTVKLSDSYNAECQLFAKFMRDFDLTEADLALDFFDAFALEFPQEADEAVIGTLACGPRADESLGVVRALDMRRTFGISPVAVIHKASDWELPTGGHTRLQAGDRLVFLYPERGPGSSDGKIDPCYAKDLQLLRSPTELQKLPAISDFGVVVYDLEAMHTSPRGFYKARGMDERAQPEHEDDEWKKSSEIIMFGARSLLLSEGLNAVCRPSFAWEAVASEAARQFARDHGHDKIIQDKSLPHFGQLWQEQVRPFLHRSAGHRGKVAMIALNGHAFDNDLLCRELAKYGFDGDVEMLTFFDPVRILKEEHGEEYGRHGALMLDRLVQDFVGKPRKGRHEALADADDLLEVLMHHDHLRHLLAARIAKSMRQKISHPDPVGVRAENACYFHLMTKVLKGKHDY